MPIPLNRIKTPEILWATLDDTLKQIRERLEHPGIKNKWRAYVLIRSDDGLYAATSVCSIRPVLWAEGPPALERCLRDLGLFHLQPGVEQQALDLGEAEQLAAKFGGNLVVLRGGRYAGLFEARDRTRRTTPKPTDAFDLFDEPLSDSVLDQAEFVTATLHNTVAKVARDLKSLRDPDKSFIVVEADDGSFQVMAALDLDLAVKRLGDSVWNLPLHRFEPHLRSAASREYRMMGRKQAQDIADRERCLVLTHEGQAVGLILSQVIWRSASVPQSPPASISHGPSHSLFDVPRDFLNGCALEIQPQKEPRFVNLWFEDSHRRPIGRSQALLLGRQYHLALNVGHLMPSRSIIDWDFSPAGPQAIVEPQANDAYLYVSVFSHDFEIPHPTKVLRLPKEGNSSTVHIQVEPLGRRVGMNPARLEVCLYYRACLVQTFRVQVEVVATGETSRNPQPQAAELAHARTTRFPDMERLPPRELSLTISRDKADYYRFSFLVDPDPDDQAAAARAVELSCLVQLTRDDLAHLITKARRQLHNVVRTFDLPDSHDTATCRKAIRALAQVGRQLYLKLFEGDDGQALAQWMDDSLPSGSTIQIVDLAGDFVFPWSLVYSAQPWDEDEPIDVQRFWGWRYKLVILTDTLLDTYCQAQSEIAIDKPLHVSVGMYERLVGATEQKAYFTNLNSQTSQQVVPEIVSSRRKMIKALTAADRDLYYFFCHGYTERIATDIQLDADLVSLFAQLAAATPDATSQSMRDHLDDLFDVSDSWMRLTRGKLPLAMLKETVKGEFSRHPLVFLNMCESAQILPSLSDGFVPFFIKRGARAVIGTECSMNTSFASSFARAFLTRFFQGERIGDILMILRRRYLEQGNPLALAYTLYSDADLRLSESVLSVSRKGHTDSDEMSEETRWQAVEVLWDDDMDGLMLTLAARVKAAEEGQAHDELQMWAPPEEAFMTEEEAGLEITEKLKALGQKWWDRLEPKLYDLLCDRNNPQHDELMSALIEGAKVLAVTLAPALVAQVAALPAVAIVIATMVGKKIADTGLDAMCEFWNEARTERAQ